MNTWDKFLRTVEDTMDKYRSEGSDILFFRGHGDSGWKLEPSLWRDNYHNRLEGILYYDFVSNAAPLLPPNSNSWDILFEMRHCGLPTRLLDWSENFAVALYFAISNAPVNPCIWILNPFKLNRLSSEQEGILNPTTDLEYSYFGAFIDQEETSYENPIAIYPTKQSKRIFAQKGAFTLHGTTRTPLEELYPECLTKIELPKNAIEKASAFLELAGINEYSVFPDLDGLSRYLCKRHLDSMRNDD